MPAKFTIEQSNVTDVPVVLTSGEGGSSGKATNLYYSERMETTSSVSGVIDGSVQGSNVQFTIHWGRDIYRHVPSATGIYTGTVGPQGRVTGTGYDEVNPDTKASWFVDEVLQCRSAPVASSASPPTMRLGRVTPIEGGTPGPVPTICQAARSARARGSPAAPGLERQCAALTPPAGGGVARINTQSSPPGVGFGRVKPAPLRIGRIKLDGVTDERSICQVAADARARNSPAAPGLERQCAQSSANSATANAGQPGPAVLEGMSGDVRLSRVYVRGGANGALSDDFVELRNRGQTPIDLSGWSLQYASSQGMTWQVVPLSGVIAPDRIFPVAAAGLQPDWTAPIQFGASAGKLALVSSTRALQGACPVDSAALVDFLGYGTANCSLENVVSAGSADGAFVRSQDGCTDTRDNGTDFTVGPAVVLDRNRAIEACPIN